MYDFGIIDIMVRLFYFYLLTHFFAWGGYRVHEYIIQGKTKKYVLKSILGLQGLPAYYGIKSEQISYVRTWVCPGNTSFKSLCSSPYGEIPPEFLTTKVSAP
jgi:hypothetical protein